MTLLSIYRELPKPLQFTRDDFIESVKDPDTILNTLRIGNANGPDYWICKRWSIRKI